MSKYLALFHLAFVHALRNRKALIGLSIFLITCLIIFSNLWKVAASRINASGLNPDSLLWYIALNEWILISMPDVHEDMESDLRSGKLAYLLPRPISYLASKFFENLGALSANLLVLGFVAFIFTSAVVGKIPFPITALPFILLITLLAGSVALLFQMAIGLSAFWLHEVSPFYWLWEKLLFILGGLMLPLSIYPEWLQKLAFFTPFPAILGERSALAIHFSGGALFSVLASLAIWGSIAFIFLLFLYRRGLFILNVEGG